MNFFYNFYFKISQFLLQDFVVFTTTFCNFFFLQIRNRVSLFNVDPFDMTLVNQTNCYNNNSKFTIDINDKTFSKENIKKTLKNVGSAIGDGVDFLVKGAKKVYHSVKNDSKAPERDREEMTQNTYANFDPNAELL